MDLPMGFNKFHGDERTLTVDEFKHQVRSIEEINIESHSIFFVICLDDQIGMVKKVLKASRYPTTSSFVIHKRWKNDKASQGGFISAAVFAVVGFKNVAVFQHAILPQDPRQKLAWSQ